MNPARRRVPSWKVLGGLAVAPLLLGGAFWLWVESSAARKEAANERRAAELLAEFRSRDASRPALGGDPLPGDAWEDYEAALQDLAKGTNRGVIASFVTRDKTADRSAVEAEVSAHAGALNLLLSGARRERGQDPAVPAFMESGGTFFRRPSVQDLANLAVCRSRILREQGRSREAADLLLAVAQLARDAGHNGTLASEMIALAPYWLSFDELREMVVGGGLTSEDLVPIERQLERVDQQFVRHGICIRNELILVHGLLRKGRLPPYHSMSEEATLVSSYRSWRQLYSDRLLVAGAFSELVRATEKAAEADALPWAQAEWILTRLEEEAKRSPNPLMEPLLSVMVSSAQAGRVRRAQLRVLRVAARYRATGEVLDLEDPLGTRLQTARAPGRLKVWSVGKDGKSDGGDTGGSPTWLPVAGKPTPRDIVLEVVR